MFGASNSGQTKELISLFTRLAQSGHQERFGLTANPGTRLEAVSNRCYTLICGKEQACAATKSVVEQALFYRSLLLPLESGHVAHAAKPAGSGRPRPRKSSRPTWIREIVEAFVRAPMIYFAGRNNGVAEELTLKTNEITRKKSDYLEGTYAVHGIEEVMNRRRGGDRRRSLPGRGGKVQAGAGRRGGDEGRGPGRRADHLPHHPPAEASRATTRSCNCWPAGICWCTWAWPWGSISTNRNGPARSATNSSG